MPHQRIRFLKPLLNKALKHSSIVGIFGHRQTGKTTLAEELGADYVSLDRLKDLELANQNPEAFLLDRKSPFVIDECQLAPPLFPALKDSVRIKKTPGQYILTGSVRFTSRKAIRESLTGRIFQLELLPMTLEEARERSLSDTLIQFLKVSDLKNWKGPAEQSGRFKQLMEHFEMGGLPGICFHRNPSIRAGKLASHMDTVLRRDLRLVTETTLPTSAIQALIIELALSQGEPLEIASLSRKVRISVKSIPHLIEAFEALFLIRTLECRGGMKKPSLFFEDSGIAHYFSRGRAPEASLAVRLAFSHFSPQFHYRPEWMSQSFCYRTRGGVEVPLAFETSLGVLGIIPTLFDLPPPGLLASAQSFQKAYPGSKVLILGHWERRGPLADGVWIDSWDHWIG